MHSFGNHQNVSKCRQHVTPVQYPINLASIHVLVEITAMFSICLGPQDTVKAFILMSTVRLGFSSLCCWSNMSASVSKAVVK